MENITKDPAYNAVDPTDFPAMLDVNRYGERSTAFDKIISATHEHFWDPLDKKYIDFTQKFDMENEYLINPDRERRSENRHRRQARREGQDQARQSRHAVGAVLDPAWRAGRVVAFGLALPHPSRSRRAGICRQPDARRSPPRHRLYELHPRALGQAREGRPRARQSAQRTRLLAARLEEDHRHADAGRRSGDGRVRDVLQRNARSADEAAHAACDDGRSLPSQIRKNLGRPHDPATVQIRTRDHRGLGLGSVPGAALQSRLAGPEGAGSIRLAGSIRCGASRRSWKRSPMPPSAPSFRKPPTSSACSSRRW